MRKGFLLPVVSALLLCACNGRMEEYSFPEPAGNVTDVALSDATISLSIGETKVVSAFVDADEEVDVTWINGDQNVISIFGTNESVSITALGTGETYVTAIAGTKSASVKVTVGGGGSQKTIVNSVSLNHQSKTISVGEEFNLVAAIDATGVAPAIQWTSSISGIVSMVPTGNAVAIKGEASGTTVITANCGGKAATCSVTVEGDDVEFFVRLNKTSLSLKEGGSDTLTATTKPENLTVVYRSNDEGVAKVDQTGKVSAIKAGTAVISATATYENEQKTAICNVTVTSNAEQDDYAKQVSAWSKPGHLYFHYLRNTDQNYDKWALWLWNSYPVDDEGVLYGANPTGYDLKNVSPHTIGWMTNGQCGGQGNDPYLDDYGRVIDVDLTEENIPGGKTGNKVKLISSWAQTELNKNNLGFLIVDQSKMTGENMWVSDGGAEVYIKKIGKHLENGIDSYLHIYCVEGNVANYKLASGKQTIVNPTIADKDGNYRSQTDISDLRKDEFASGVSTSETFLNDKPGVGYQIFVPSFADSDGDGFGDLQGIIGKLQYLDDLGVKVLWLTPIQESNSYHGYDVTDYYKIDSRFGTLQDYQELIYKAHQRGMKVLMDMVINHTSKSNVLYQKSQVAAVEEINGKRINYRDMYLWKFKGDPVRVWDKQDPTTSEGVQHANFVTKNVEDTTDWYKDGTSDYYYFGKFGSGMAELNYSCKATREYMTEMCKYWLSFGLDGFRLDAIKHIYLLGELDPATPLSTGKDVVYDVGWKHYYNPEMGKYIDVENDYSYDRSLNVMFWKQFAGTIKSAYPNCFLVGENFDGWNERMAPFYQAIDSQFDFQLYYALNEMGEAAASDKIYANLNVYQGQADVRHGKAINGAFTSNHDVARMLNHCAGHDASIAHKASEGEAIHHTEVNSSNHEYALKQARYYAAMSILAPGCSWIYYGDEIGLCGNTGDKMPDSKGVVVDDHGNNVDRWYRQPMKWGATRGQDNVVSYQFSGMEVLWDSISQNIRTVPQQEQDPNSLLSYFKLLTATKNNPKFPTYGMISDRGSIAGKEGTGMFKISDGTNTAIVYVNNTDSNAPFNYMGVQEILGQSPNCSRSGDNFVVGPRGFMVTRV